MTFPTELATLISSVATGTISMMTTVISTYWPWILGLVVAVGLITRFKRLVGLAR